VDLARAIFILLQTEMVWPPLQPGLAGAIAMRPSLITSEVKYMHLSCAGIHHPNLGANDVVGMIGLTWFF